MRIICSQARLAPALSNISRIAKPEPLPWYQSVLVTATSGHAPEQGTLTLVGMGIRGTVGVITQIPATIEQDGLSLAPIEPLTEYVETLPSGADLTLSQQKDENPSTATQHEKNPFLAARKASFPLHIESAAMGLATHAQLTSWHAGSYPLPPVQEWLASGVAIATMPALVFKEAVADCTPYANAETWSKDNAAEMDGIFMRVEGDSMDLFAATGTMLVRHRIPLESPAPLSFTDLFAGKALAWIEQALTEESGEITFLLAQDPQTQQRVLLLSLPQVTWFCRSMDAPSPTSWDRTFHVPHEMEFLIRRFDLRLPLTFYANAEEASEGLVLRIEGIMLSISAIASSDEPVQREQSLPLVASSADLMLLVNPQQFQRLMCQVSGELLRLEVGHFERQEQQATRQIGFVRASSGHLSVMMSLSRIVEQWVSCVPQDSSSARSSVSTVQAR